jgi:lysophospholipid acyltransferase (LPLAT)-like uncharacterized protein
MRALAATAGRVLGRLYRIYYRTLRLRALLHDGSVTTPGEYAFGREIFALCERDALALAGVVAGRGFTALAAPGRDGEWAAGALGALGCTVVRGASARGGAGALRRLVRALRASDAPAGLVVDGPLGPAGAAKPGAAYCAAKTGRQVFPLAAAARPAIVFPRTWSGIYVPAPFARVVIVVEAPLGVPDDGFGDAGRAPASEELTRRLARARARAVAACRTRARASRPALVRE